MGKTREAGAVIGGLRGVAGWVEKDREGIPRGFGRVAAEGTGGWDKAPRI